MHLLMFDFKEENIMATISEMLLRKDLIAPNGNLGPAGKAVKEYKEILEKYLEEHPEYSKAYEPGNKIGEVYFAGSKMKLNFYCGGDDAKFDLYFSSLEQLEYALREEGLQIKSGNGLADGVYFIYI